jgi:DNA-binding NarL/FixJ family response regulator
MADRRYTIVLADDDERVRDALSDLLDDHPRLRVVATAAVFTKGEPVDLAGELEELVAARRSC